MQSVSQLTKYTAVMVKKLTSVCQSETSDQDLPLILHFAMLYDAEEDILNQPEMLKISNTIIHRYKTTHYLPGNKFFKPISRILEA
jgi:hypothetical protein